jgi:hypothetical protein
MMTFKTTNEINMKKFIAILLYSCSFSSFAANEQNFIIENNLDVSKLELDRSKYIETLESVVKDVEENGFHFKIGSKKNIEPHRFTEGLYVLTINDVELIIKKDVITRNFKKSNIFKSKILTNEAINIVKEKSNLAIGRSKKGDIQWFDSTSGTKSYICIVSRLKDGNGELIAYPKNVYFNRMIDFNNFTNPTLPTPNTSLEERVRDGNIVGKSEIRYVLTLEQISQLKNISLSAEKCNPNF